MILPSIDPRHDITSDVVTKLLIAASKMTADAQLVADICDSFTPHVHKTLDTFCEYVEALAPVEHARLIEAMQRILTNT